MGPADGPEDVVLHGLGFTDTRVQPLVRRTASFSAVMVSGRPASTVYSTHAERSTASSNSPISRSS